MQFIGFLSVLAALVTPVTPAATAPTHSPVAVSGCSIDSTRAALTTNGDALETLGRQVHIKFVNTGSEPIQAVTFDVAENGTVTRIRDVGHFAQGATISHYFRQGLLPESGSPSCRVASVEYENGTTMM